MSEDRADSPPKDLEIDAPAITPNQVLALFSAKEHVALIDAVFDVLRTTVPCDFASAFYRGAGDGLLKGCDSRGREYSPELMRRHVQLSPAIPIALTRPGVRILSTQKELAIPEEELRQMAFYREIMKPLGWRHSVALCFWSSPPGQLPFFVATVERGQGRRDFSDPEIASLERVYPFLDCAVHRVHERQEAATMRDGIVSLQDDTRGLAILNASIALVQENAAAQRLWELGSPESDLPPALEATCRTMLNEWQAMLRANPDAEGMRRRQTVPLDATGSMATVTMLCPHAASLAEPSFVIEIDTPENEGNPHIVSFDQFPGTLTPLERLVITALADGASNQEIADRLGKSVAAVKFALHRVYRKTGLPNRAAVVGALRSQRAGRSL
jgi:DNA-binding CsgD family transcriptional regulator